MNKHYPEGETHHYLTVTGRELDAIIEAKVTPLKKRLEKVEKQLAGYEQFRKDFPLSSFVDTATEEENEDLDLWSEDEV